MGARIIIKYMRLKIEAEKKEKRQDNSLVCSQMNKKIKMI